MALLDHITLEDTPAGTAVRNYLEGQHDCSEQSFASSLSEDIIFHGQMFKATGRDAVVAGFMEFLNNMVVSMRVEAVTRVADTDQFIALFHLLLKGNVKEMPIVDLVRVKDGQIYRVDNCFDMDKVTKQISEYSAKVSNM